MRIKFLILTIVLSTLLFGCVNKNQEKEKYDREQTPFTSIELDNVGYITVKKKEFVYEIRDREELYSILFKLQNSHKEFIKFGSNTYFTIYNINVEEIIFASFRDNRYKVNGVVYRSEQNIFD